MATTQEVITNVFLNSKQAESKINELQKKAAEFRKQYEEAFQKGDAKGIIAAERAMNKVNRELKAMRTNADSVNGVLNNLSTSGVDEIKETIKAINKELSSGKVKRGSEDWEVLTKELRKCKAELQGIQNEMRVTESGWKRMFNFLNTNWGALTQILGALSGITMTARKSVQAYADMEESMADVRKYTGQTAEEVEHMNEVFKTLDTRTPREQLNELAGAAGRLGITSEKAILEFVDAADIISVALGDDLGNGAVDQIGKLTMAFGEDDKMGLRGAMLATGSAVNALAGSSASNAGYLVDFAARIAGVGMQAGLTQTQILGFAATLDENMLRDEMAATALSQVITSMAKDASKFAKMAGVDVKEFSNLVKTDMNQALLTFFKAMGEKEGGFTTLSKMFEDLGLDGARVTSVLTTMANKIDDVVKHQATATEAYKQGQSVIDEFNTKNETAQAGLDKAKKNFLEVAIALGEKLMPIMKYGINTASLGIKVLYQITQFVPRHIVAIASLTSAIVIYTAAVNATIIKTKLLSAIQAARVIAVKGYTTVVQGLTAAKIALQIIMAKLEGNWQRQSSLMLDVQRKGITMTSAYGALISVAILLGAAIYGLIQKWKEHKEAMERNNVELQAQKKVAEDMKEISKEVGESVAEETQRIEFLNKVIHSNVYSVGERRKAIKDMQKIIPGYQASLSNEGVLHEKNTKAIREHVEMLRELAMAEAIYKKVVEAQAEQVDAVLTQKIKQNNIKAVDAEIQRHPEIYNAVKDNSKTYTSATGQTYTITDITPTEANAQKHNERQVHVDAYNEAVQKEQVAKRRVDLLIAMARENKTRWDRYQQLSAGAKGGFNSSSIPISTTPKGTGNSGGGEYVTEKEKKAAAAAAAHEEAEEKKRQAKMTKAEREKLAAEKKAAAAALKAKKDAETAEKNEYNKNMAELAQQYADGLKSRHDYLEEEYDLQMKHFARLKEIWGENSEEYKGYVDDMIKIQTAYEKRREEEDLPNIEKDHKMMQRKIQEQFYDESSAAYHNQETINEALFQENIDYLEKKKNLYKEGSQKRLQLEAQIEDAEEQHKLDRIQANDEKLSSYREKWGKLSIEKQKELELEGLDYLLAQKLISEEEFQKMRLAIIAEYSRQAQEQEDTERTKSTEDILSLARGKLSSKDRELQETDMANGGIGGQIFGITTAIKNYKTMYEAIGEMRKNDEISEEEAAEAKKKIWQDMLGDITSKAQAAYDGINTIVNAASAYARACSEYEVAKITSDYDKQIQAAGKNSKKREKLEKERDEKIRAAKTKANQQAMKIEIAQAFASTALAAINAYSSAAQVPYIGYILGPIAAAAATAAGMLQIATIKKQHQTEQMGYYSGGFTGGKDYRRQAGIVHEGEFVANHQAVNNPAILPALQLIDSAQKNNTISRLTGEDVSRAVGGGASAVVAPIVNVNNDNPALNDSLGKVKEVLEQLEAQLAEGLTANVSIDGRNGVAYNLDRYNKMKKRV